MNDMVRTFKKGDIVHFRTSENQSNKIVEAEII